MAIKATDPMNAETASDDFLTGVAALGVATGACGGSIGASTASGGLIGGFIGGLTGANGND